MSVISLFFFPFPPFSFFLDPHSNKNWLCQSLSLKHLIFRFRIKVIQNAKVFLLNHFLILRGSLGTIRSMKSSCLIKEHLWQLLKIIFPEIKTKLFSSPHSPPNDNHVWLLFMSKYVFSPRRRLVKRVCQFPFVLYLQLWEKNDLWLL